MQFVMTVDVLKTTSIDKLPNDLEGMEASMERLLALIDDIYKYVDNVVVSDVRVSFTNCLSFAYDVTSLSGRACRAGQHNREISS